MRNERFKLFSNDEMYMLKRQAIESSFNIVCEERYSDEEVKIYDALLNEIVDECRLREYNLD